METIKNYLEAMFLHLPKTPEVFRAKNELAQMMEDKYTELIASGMRENEAVGTVITEFGNLDELAEGLGIRNLMDDANPGSDTQTGARQEKDGDAAQNGFGDGQYGNGAAPGGTGGEQYGAGAASGGTGEEQHGAGAAPFPGYTTAKTVYKAREDEYYESKKLATFMSVYWLTVLCIYLLWSFLTFRWYFTWIIWPIAGVIHAIIKKAFGVETRGNR